ncbi:arginine repressor [Holzapfeliella sp. JNUCC 80]
MKQKKRRQDELLKILKSHHIQTQSELMDHLNDKGITITQATLSRDMKELGIIKLIQDDSQMSYVVSGTQEIDDLTQLKEVFTNNVQDVLQIQFTVIVKCNPNSANVLSALIDNHGYPELVASLAGYDTIVCYCADEEEAKKLKEGFLKLN